MASGGPPADASVSPRTLVKLAVRADGAVGWAGAAAVMLSVRIPVLLVAQVGAVMLLFSQFAAANMGALALFPCHDINRCSDRSADILTTRIYNMNIIDSI